MIHLPRVSRFFQIIGTNLNITRCLNTQKLSHVSPLLLQFPCTNYSWIWQKNNNIKLPVFHDIIIEIPNNFKVPPLMEEPMKEKLIEAPSTIDSDVSKQAARLIVIRRKKMKKHKLKKLRKRMKFEWAKLRQRRELKKEKAFQAVLIQQCKEGEAFSAEQYVQERIEKLNEIVIPRYWKGRRLPEFIIREKMGLPPKK